MLSSNFGDFLRCGACNVYVNVYNVASFGALLWFFTSFEDYIAVVADDVVVCDFPVELVAGVALSACLGVVCNYFHGFR